MEPFTRAWATVSDMFFLKPRLQNVGATDAEMFGLAGFPGRVAFLADFHTWLVGKMTAQATPLAVAEEIAQPQAALLADIARMKARNAISDPEGAIPRCGDEPLPVVDFANWRPVNGGAGS